MSKLNVLALAACLAAAVTACGTSIQETQINAAPHPLMSRPPESVEVFSSGPPPRAHIDVSYFEAQQSSGFSTDNTPEFVGKLRIEAARRGCDGIVLGGTTNEVTVYNHGSSNQKGIVATCIVYTN